MKISLSALCASTAIGCSGPPATVAAGPPVTASAAVAPAPLPATGTAVVPAVAEGTAKPADKPAEDPTQFPPAGFKPPFERTAKPGDGAWTAMSEAPMLFRTSIHPHPVRWDVSVVIVAIDLRRAELHLVAGTLEPKSTTVPKEHRIGLIPVEAQADLIAVMNGGFMSKHGGYGMKIGSDVFLPPREDACTVALMADGAIRIGTWSALKASEASMTAYRQMPPCLVEQGAVHPTLVADPSTRKWGVSEQGKLEVRRSALGLDASGRTLFYGVGEWITPKELAEAMSAAGAQVAAEADINWSYTRFLFFGRPDAGAPLQVVSTLIPQMKYVSQGYVTKASERDFFYLKRRR